MTYEQLNIALVAALRQGDHARCLEMLDQFIETAQGLELGHALSSKAGYLMIHDERRSVEGLNLLDDALAVALGSPTLQMNCIIRGLGLCYNIGDTERAKRYEQLAHELLRDPSEDVAIHSLHPSLYFNLAQIAWLRQELAQAYWHLVQATKSVASVQQISPDEQRRTLFRYYIRTAEICLEMNRTPESEDALVKANACITSPDEEYEWRLVRASYLLAANQLAGARQLLDDFSAIGQADLSPYHKVSYHLVSSLVAQGSGDVREFHFHLARAQDHALDHHLDHMLARIQRVMRTPVRLEAAK